VSPAGHPHPEPDHDGYIELATDDGVEGISVEQDGTSPGRETDAEIAAKRFGTTWDLVDLLAELDALRTMGVTTRRLGWALPELVDAERFLLEGEGLYHPFLDAPTGNPVEIAGGDPVVASASSSPR
jgi:hypothetical protein